jgi:GH15 family glucan-1,4-alpha-glucosidase
MASKLEDYALIGDLETAALVSREGSIDWMCVPRFDSQACFASLLGTRDNGYWSLAPSLYRRSTRKYREDTLVLETRFEADDGVVTLIDCMPIRAGYKQPHLLRLVRGESGHVHMRMELAIRFDYGMTVPWVKKRHFGITALSGAHALQLQTPVKMEGRDFRHYAEFDVGPGEVVPFVLAYHSSLEPEHTLEDAETWTEDTTQWWQDWTSKCKCEGEFSDAVTRSLITLKALTHQSSGGIVAAPTTSLPETIGGQRNWDYRFCWLRDATFTLYALVSSGLYAEAEAWRDWLLRVAAGKPSQLQTIYGPTGERLLPEFVLDWLDGYEDSKPVRVGNQAHRQLQLDVYGEIMDVFHVARTAGIKDTADSWALQRALMDFLESGWRRMDNGIWEVRGRRRHFTHSKVMAWVALDRAVKGCQQFGLEGPVDHWIHLRDRIHADVLANGFDAERNAFVQYYGGSKLDASLLMIPLVGFLPPDDPRVVGTLQAIERELLVDGFVQRYVPDPRVEGLPPEPEGTFLPCTFWLADNYALMGRHKDACEVFERLLSIRNDVGLLSEEYDARSKRLLGNFPQAFTHVSLINTAQNITAGHGATPVEQRASSGAGPRQA